MTETDTESAALTLAIANWSEDKALIQSIRYRVFVQEQGVPQELEWDEFDRIAIHFLACYRQQPVATARLKPDGQIGRMAVLKPFRGKHTGSRLLQFVMQTAREKKVYPLYLHAQLAVIDFYRRQGFIERGDIFMDAGIAHQEMVLAQVNSR